MKNLWLAFLLSLALSPLLAENIDGAIHVSGGTDTTGKTQPTFSAGFHIDPAFFSSLGLRSQTFEIGFAYDRVQREGGGTVDFRVRVPVLRCYGWEFRCGQRRFWITAVPSIAKRWGGGGLSGYAAIQTQAVFDLSRNLACCRLAIGVEHRFPFDSPLRNDNAVVLELRTFIGFIDKPPPHPRSTDNR